MKKIAGALLIGCMYTGATSADVVTIDPLLLMAGGIGVSYQYDLDKESAIVGEHVSYYQSVFGSELGLGYTTVTLKMPFPGHSLHHGAYWRAGGGMITVASGFTGLTAFGPVGGAGYTHQFNKEWSISGEFTLGAASFIKVGYTF